MHVPVVTTTQAGARSEVDVYQRFAECEPASLIADQRAKNIAGLQHAGDDRLLSLAQVNATGDCSGAPQARHFSLTVRASNIQLKAST